ncbi:MAG TPA: D-glycerate dehydrogenase [Pseudonocardiaceae bacterium]|nr:D-glycerate dehydrogenase [Pseudonocardiaceae bacterium]
MSERPRIAVTRAIPAPALDLLRAAGDVWISDLDRPLTEPELHSAVSGADAVVSMLHDRVDTAVLDAAGPSLRIVANVAVGYDNIDVAALASHDVTLTNTPGVLTDATADLALGLMLMLTRRLGEGERLLRARQPWSFHLGFMLGAGLRGKVLGIVGLGQIGQAVARRAAPFGLRIVYTGRRRAAADLEAELGATHVSMPELLETADIVSLHCPLTPQTHHLIDAAALKAMKATAYLVNTTRGPVVDESALADALADGSIAGAALDVFEREPDVEPRLLEADNAVVTPHLGSATVETRTEMAVLAARNVVAVLSGEPPLTPVAAR